MIKKILIFGLIPSLTFFLFIRPVEARIIRSLPLPKFPIPTIIKPLPPPLPVPPLRINKGKVQLQAYLHSCGVRSAFVGTFYFCPQSMLLKEKPSIIGNACFSLTTNKNGRGNISLPVGGYRILPPFFCPPGVNCILENQKIWNPISWDIQPSIFNLEKGQTVGISAVGTNHLLMCPIKNAR